MIPFSCFAGWTQEEGKWFTSQQLNYFRTSHFIQEDGQKIKRPPFSKYEWNSYLEYGLTDTTTVGANLFLQQLDSKELYFDPLFPTPQTTTHHNFGLADSEFFLRQSLWKGKIKGRDAVLAIQPLIKIPSFYESGDSPQSGTDNFDMELRLQAGYLFTLRQRQHFAKFETGYRKRYGEWRDQWKMDATFGLRLNEQWTFLQQLFVTTRAEGTGISNNSLAANNDYDLAKGQLSLLYEVAPATTLQVGAFSHLVARNTGDGEGVTFAIWYRF